MPAWFVGTLRLTLWTVVLNPGRRGLGELRGPISRLSRGSVGEKWVCRVSRVRRVGRHPARKVVGIARPYPILLLVGVAGSLSVIGPVDRWFARKPVGGKSV